MTTVGNAFSIDDPDLFKTLEQIDRGEIQLPDFQRSWVWDDHLICSLIASVSLSYPIGVVMLLDTVSETTNFKCRAIEGAPESSDPKPSSLILDGQQRMTALYLVLRSGKEVLTKTVKGRETKRVYYLDITKCLDKQADREDAVVSLSPDRKRLTDFNRKVEIDVSTADKEYERGFFPLSQLINYSDWRRGYTQKFQQDDAKLDDFDEFEKSTLQHFTKYRIATIKLLKETSKEAVCQVFEKVNTGGVALTVFELMTATYAADNFNLRQDWERRKEKFEANENISNILSSVEATDFLQAVTLLATNQMEGVAVSCKRKNILDLKLAQYKENADIVVQGFISAAKLLIREKIFDARGLPYNTQLVPLAAVCAHLGDECDNDSTKQKLARWYWCGVFGELYAGATETRAAKDLVDLLDWLAGGEEPGSFGEANFSPTRLLSLQSRQSAAYKGMMALLMQLGSKDFISGDSAEFTNFVDDQIDIHHIFPKAYCDRKKYPREHWNSIVNKTAISASTNRRIGSRAPSEYLAKIGREDGIGITSIDEFLTTHEINPPLLREDKFAEFIRDRAARLLVLIEKAMGKEIVGWDSEEVVKEFGEALTRPIG